MKGNVSLSDLGTKIAKLVERFGLLAVFLVIAAGLIICVFLLNNVITETDNAHGYVSDVNKISFDEETIQKIKDLKEPGEQTERLETSGRLLPF